MRHGGIGPQGYGERHVTCVQLLWLPGDVGGARIRAMADPMQRVLVRAALRERPAISLLWSTESRSVAALAASWRS
jgi:hypothetical protein